VSDSVRDTIRQVTPAGVVTTLAGLAGHTGNSDGSGSAARFDVATGLAVDGAGDVYAADTENSLVRKGFLASSVPAPVLHRPSLSGGRFGFDITGLAGLAVDVESSVDLFDWQVAGTYILKGGTAHFISPTPLRGARFYRGHVR